ncbi:hypothetical protein DPMN_035958 [Dreissena polymorpha]|uniref:C2H2-type domain-containing protein n=1 Tax=Dreissena polymorpha TaxID=45954 RepID=A0A9D4MAP3_DREPO|nr:hypothetical protein DPMN_035958 [Dreissena polymorpha]
MSESELMNVADGSLLDISLEEELCTSERFSCGICETSYARKAYLKRHLKTHDLVLTPHGPCLNFAYTSSRYNF